MIIEPQLNQSVLAGVTTGSANASLANDREVLSSARRVRGDDLSTLRTTRSSTEDTVSVFTRTGEPGAVAKIQTQGLRAELVRAETVLQVAQEAFTAIEIIYAGMQELAVIGLEENLTKIQREKLNDEFQVLKQDIEDIVDATVFDGEDILKGGDGPDGEFVITLSAVGEAGMSRDILVPSAALVDKGEGLEDIDLLTVEASTVALELLDKAGQVSSLRGDMVEQQRATLQQIYATEVDSTQTLTDYVATFETPKYAENLVNRIQDIVLAGGKVPFEDAADRLRDIVGRFVLDNQLQDSPETSPTTRVTVSAHKHLEAKLTGNAFSGQPASIEVPDDTKVAEIRDPQAAHQPTAEEDPDNVLTAERVAELKRASEELRAGVLKIQQIERELSHLHDKSGESYTVDPAADAARRYAIQELTGT